MPDGKGPDSNVPLSLLLDEEGKKSLSEAFVLLTEKRMAESKRRSLLPDHDGEARVSTARADEIAKLCSRHDALDHVIAQAQREQKDIDRKLEAMGYHGPV